MNARSLFQNIRGMAAQSVKEGLKMRINKLHITADKREIKDFPKLPSATSDTHKPLYAIVKINVAKSNKGRRK